jgi:uncharacterized protein
LPLSTPLSLSSSPSGPVLGRELFPGEPPRSSARRGSSLARGMHLQRAAMEASKNGMSTLSWIAIVLTIIGAINWGIVGLFDYNLVGAIFRSVPVVARIIYVLVGLSGLYLISLATRLSQVYSTTTRRPL